MLIIDVMAHTRRTLLTFVFLKKVKTSVKIGIKQSKILKYKASYKLKRTMTPSVIQSIKLKGLL